MNSNVATGVFRSEAWASLSRLGAGQYALSLVADPESSQATHYHYYSSTTDPDLDLFLFLQFLDL